MPLPDYLQRIVDGAGRARELAESVVRSSKTPQARTLEAEGYERWAVTLGPRTFKKPFAPFHHRFWRWYWPARQKLLRGEPLSPEELAALLIWGRGLGKSSHVEWACIAEGALAEGVTDEPGFVGYICADSDLAKGHVQSIRARLDSPEVAAHYPGLANPRIDKRGFQEAWRQDRLVTDSGWGIIPIGLKEGVRGGRLGDMRFSMFVFDDVDSRRYSADVIRKNLEVIAYEILPAGTPQTLKLFPQNLVREDGVLAQILRRETDVLSARTVIGDEAGEPQKAFEEVKLELDDERPNAYKIVSALPVWEGLDVAAASVFLADSGRAGFLAEYQHDLTGERSEFVLPHWRDEVHVVTRAQFERVYGTRTIPRFWGRRWFNDWAKTNTAKHCNAAGCFSVSGQNTPLPGVAFLSECMSFKDGVEPDDVAVRILKAIAPGAKVGGVFKPWDEILIDSAHRTNLRAYSVSLSDMLERERDVRSRVLPDVVQKVLTEQKLYCFRGSHEENNNVLAVYRRVYGLPFKATNPGAGGGIETLNDLMRVDRTRPHPFKPDTREADGLYKLGFTRFYLLLSEGEEVAEPKKNVNPRELFDSARARYQLRRWRHLPVADTVTGEVERGPEKRNDDFGNGLQFCTHDGLPPAAPLEQWEQDELALHPDLRWEVVEKIKDKAVQAQAIMSRDLHLRAMRANREEGFDARRPFRAPRVRFRR